LAHWVLVLVKPYVRAVRCLLAKRTVRAVCRLVLAKPAVRALHDVKPLNSTFFSVILAAVRAVCRLILAKPAGRALHDVKPSNSTFFSVILNEYLPYTL
jgi:hypothetical protein